MRKVLIINPNSISKLTQHIRNVIERIKCEDTYVEVVDFPEGPLSIESEYDVALVVPRLIDTIKREYERFDSFLIACFADPGLEILKEIFDKPIVGMLESSIHITAMLRERISIITISEKRVNVKIRYLRSIGLIDRIVSFEPLNMSVIEMVKNPQKMIELAVEASLKARSKGAEAVILGCASMAGYAKQIENKSGIHTIDPLVIGFKLAETLADINLKYI
ncbi:MAG: aspartate/glutamate racemase family protein [Saccharolobus sp.]|uniref:aspartate/glutamate racemase family protein n=1 Tax=Saccharolobus sp. TaxID=2100761 RepID=UPI0031729B85